MENPMESFDSSPHYMKPTNSSDAKKEISPQGGSGFDDVLSISFSTGRSVSAPNQKIGINHRTNNKKALISLGNVKSFRRRTKSRISSLDSSNATSYSKGNKTHSQPNPRCSVSLVDSSDEINSLLQDSSLVLKNRIPLKTFSRSSSNRNVRILIKRASFKAKSRFLSYSRDSEDFSVDRATHSSIIKDSKFPEPVQLHAEMAESERMHVCRYHHCSLHGHCHENHDPDTPPKPVEHKNKWSLKKQKHVIPNTDQSSESKCSGDKKTNLHKYQMISSDESSVHKRKNDNVAFSDFKYMLYDEIPNTQPYVEGYSGIQEFDILEIAFGETSFPERSYQESLDIMRKYSLQEIDGASYGLKGYCLKCSRNIEKQITSTPRTTDVDLPQHRVSASSLGSECNNKIPQNVDTNVLDTFSTAFSEKPQEQFRSSVEDFATFDETSDKNIPKTPVIFDEVTNNNSLPLSVSDSQVSSDTNSEVDGELTIESTSAESSFSSNVMQANDCGLDVPSNEGNILQFSKPRHISMWHLIHQHMASEMATEAMNKSLQPAEGENQADSSNSLLAKKSSASYQNFSDSNNIGEENSPETQDIEVRKLFAIKLVREAIEKILLPEIQDDQSSVTSESTPRHEKKESEASTRESNEEFDAEKVEAILPSNPEDAHSIIEDASSSKTMKIIKSSAIKSERKAPKHWSNLKKWILLQRFIKELEKVRKFNPKKPRILPLNPDPMAEKVNLRHQTVDEKKKGEEWMLDYALRQAVNQLAPTQKRKVALLVKAFETVVPAQEESPVQIKTPKLNDNIYMSQSCNDDKVSGLGSENQGNYARLTRKSWNLFGSNGELKSTEINRFGSSEEPEESERGKGKESLDTQRWINDDSGRSVATEKEAPAKPEVNLLQITSDLVDKNEPLDFQSDRKNHIKMWHTIYQHVVSGIADKLGSQLLNGSDDDDDAEDDDKSPEVDNDDYRHDFTKCNGFTKADALKLVKEVVDEILVTDTPYDSSDTQSITSELISDGEISEENLGERKTPKPRNWIKLKKLLLIKKSIKALEKAREVNTQQPAKVALERQMMDERKKAKQWMLDYAVQHIVDKLTPARRLRVYMLVEAFEAVVPLPEM